MGLGILVGGLSMVQVVVLWRTLRALQQAFRGEGVRL
jgi:hypothetical protein